MSTPNTVPLTWNGFVTQLANLAVVDTVTVGSVVQGADPGFQTLLPQAINYAEFRIQRDLDILPLLTTDSYTTTPSNPTLAIPANDFVTVQTLSISGTPLLPVSKEWLQNVYGSASTLAQPLYFAMVGGDRATGGNTSNNVLLGPWPDTTYSVDVFGTIRAPSLYQSATTPLAATATTFISTNYPDMLLMAAMVFVSAFQRNWGKMSDDPAMAMSYEAAYKALLPAASTEEMRKKFESSAWSSMSPAVAASPGR